MKHQKLLDYALPLLCGLTMASLCQLNADQNTVMKNAPAKDNPVGECSKEFLISYFPASIVEVTLEKFHVPKENQAPIIKDLAESEKKIISSVEEKASKITPNPLKDPQQRQVAVKIFRETLMEIFSGVLEKNGVNDEKQVQAMLEDIQQQKAKKFAECLEKHKQPAESGASMQGADKSMQDKSMQDKQGTDKKGNSEAPKPDTGVLPDSESTQGVKQSSYSDD